jgi:hypothetical protein
LLAHCAFWLRKPSLSVEADQRVLDLPGHENVLDDLQAVLDQATVELLPYGTVIPLRQFYSHYKAIKELAGLEVPLPQEVRDLQLILAKHVLPSAKENQGRAIDQLFRCVVGTLTAHYRMDRAHCFNYDLDNGQIKLSVCEPVPTSFIRDGKERPAWRCVLPVVVGDTSSWASWTADRRGAPHGSPSADVFVQSHALKNLRDRVPIPEWRENGLDGWASYSLCVPVLIPQGPKRWLVELRIGKDRLGYFTAVEIDGRILVTTFLFLTMRDTPEGKLIRERLGLRADEIEWLRADSLPFFTQSDVAQDSELRAILTECGCGHLFDLIEPEAREITFRGAARDLRRHLGMPIPPLMQGLFAR